MRRELVVALCLSSVVSRADAQQSLRPYVAVGATWGLADISSVSPKAQLNGRLASVGLAFDLVRGHSIAAGGFYSDRSLAWSHQEQGDGPRVLSPAPAPQDRNASVTGYFARWIIREKRDRNAGGLASELGLSYVRLDDGANASRFLSKSAGMHGGVFYETRAFSGVAPTIGMRGYLHRTTDGHLYRAVTVSLSFASR